MSPIAMNRYIPLPYELRQQIYTYVFSSTTLHLEFDASSPSTIQLQLTTRPPSTQSLLLVSSSTHTEALQSFYAHSHLLIEGHGPYHARLAAWPLIPARLKHLRDHIRHVGIGSGFDECDVHSDYDYQCTCADRPLAYSVAIAWPQAPAPVERAAPNFSAYDLTLLPGLEQVTLFLRCRYDVHVRHVNERQFCYSGRDLVRMGRLGRRYARKMVRDMQRYGKREVREGLSINFICCGGAYFKLDHQLGWGDIKSPDVTCRHCSYALEPDGRVAMREVREFQTAMFGLCRWCEPFTADTSDLVIVEPCVACLRMRTGEVARNHASSNGW